jgi:periplasmic divalent cation tolerance protein
MVTSNSEHEAEKIAKKLVENKLAACVSIIPKMRSIYIWDDKIQDDEELLMIIKSRTELFDKIKDTIKGIHSYTVPEIISLPITHALEEYLSWIDSVTA